jgi:hypothetical protein
MAGQEDGVQDGWCSGVLLTGPPEAAEQQEGGSMKSRGPMKTLAVVILLLGAVGSLSALMVRLSPEQLKAASDVIVTGTVTSTASQWDETHSAIYTAVTVATERFDKGHAASLITVRVPGGEVGDIGLRVSDMPSFSPSDRATWYLTRTSDAAVFELVGGEQGKVVLGGKPSQPVYYKWGGYHWNPPVSHFRTNWHFPDAWIPAIDAGVTAWNTAGSPFRYYNNGTTEDTDIVWLPWGAAYMSDSVNFISWRQELPPTIIIRSCYWYNKAHKVIYLSATEFNPNLNWSTGDPTPTDAYDVQNAITRELGWCLGLDYLTEGYQSEMTMFNTLYPGETKKRTLEFGDTAGVKAIYGRQTLHGPQPGGRDLHDGIAVSGLEPAAGRLGLSVSPNPCQGRAVVAYSLPRSGDVSLKLFDVTGKLAATLASGLYQAGVARVELPDSGLNPGVYVLKLESGSSSQTRKLIIQ